MSKSMHYRNEQEWHKEIRKRKTPGGKGERNPSVSLDELREALEDILRH